MFKKLILVGFIFLFSSNLARAEVVINEIAWMGTSVHANCEWIELYNNGETNVDLNGWALYEQEGEVKIINLSKIIAANGYFLVERVTPASCPDPILGVDDVSGSFGGSGFVNLPSGEFLILKDAGGNTIQSLDFSGGWLAGNNVTKETMQWNGSSWITATPTPKAINVDVTPPPPPPPADNSSPSGNNNSGSSGGSFSSAGGSTKITEVPKIKTQIIAKALGFVGMPLFLEAKTLGLSGEPLRYGKYFWNFGDGDSKETEVAYSGKFTHNYFYPGDYVVSLSYYANYYSNVPDASDQIVIKIIGTDISVSRVGDEKDFFIELLNNTDYNADLSNWLLVSSTKSFTIPRNTILAAKKKMIISPRITNFSMTDKNTLKLMNSEGEVVFDYSASSPARVVLAETPTPSLILPLSKGETPKAEGVDPNVLQASAISSETASNDNSSNASFPIIPLASLIFIGASAGAVYFIRQKRVIPEKGDDFEILDE